MTDTTDPNDDRSVLMRALDIAFPIVEADIATPDITAALTADDADPIRVLAHAFLGAMDRLADRAKMPTAHRCGWCHAAAGGDGEAWHALPSMGDAEIKAHALICEHNPLVAAIRAVVAAHDNCRYVMGPSPAVYETMERLRELVAPGPVAP
jgi:hypothetical protein